jgi:hypothetical protein
VILVHDAARPLVTDAILERLIGALAQGFDGAVPGLPLTAVAEDIQAQIEPRAGGRNKGHQTRRIRGHDRWAHRRKALGTLHGSSPPWGFHPAA